MKLALISPKGVGMGNKSENSRTGQIYGQLQHIESLRELMSCPNAPLLTVAAIAAPYFDEIVYIDEEVETIDFSAKYDIVGMSFMTQQASRAYELAMKYKELGAYTVCGGMHPTNLPEQTSEYFDTVFIGEGEYTWPDFIRDYQQGRPEKFYRNTKEVDMEKVRMPRYDLLNMEKYKTIPVQISRGCPHNCAFCASTKVYGPKYRHKSVDQVMAEIGYIQTFKQYPHIYFTDDNMLVQKEFAENLLDSLKETKIHWMTHTDIGIADDEELLPMLYPSGCRKMVIGFESIEPNSLKNIEKWKYRHLNDYGNAIQRIQSYGIGVWGTFIVGLDGDDPGVFQKVIDFTMENHLYGAMISVPTPFPGSQLYDQLEKEDRILTKHWGSYTLWNVVVKPKQMTVKQLEDGFEYTLKQIYSEEASKNRMMYFKNLYGNRNRL